MRLAVLGVAAVCLAYAQQEVPSGNAALIAKVRARMADVLEHLPDYTCSQTTERFRRRGPNRAFERVDRVRLEVALVDGKELFGWPGSHQIAESDLTRLIDSPGAISNGTFALLAKGVFLSPATTFTPRGDAVFEGVHALRFDYRVPPEASAYHLRVDSNDAVVGYHGSFWTDRDSLDLLRLVIEADHIPQSLGLTSATDAMDYARVKIGDSDFLLPRISELTIAVASGLEDRNRTQFHGCQRFTGESTLSFADPANLPKIAPHKPPADVTLPRDFQVDVALLTPITASSAVGDPVEARLAHAIRRNHKILMEKGSMLQGRITQLHADEGFYHVGIAFLEIMSKDGRADLSGRQNVLFLGGGPREFHVPLAHAALRRGLVGRGIAEAGRLEIPIEGPLELKRGCRITLRSLLVQSGK